jgi:hypothetical protein
VLLARRFGLGAFNPGVIYKYNIYIYNHAHLPRDAHWSPTVQRRRCQGRPLLLHRLSHVGASQYRLVFANCLDGGLKVNINVRSAIYNIDPTTRERQCLSVGSSVLPSFYFLFYLPYASLTVAWVYILLHKWIDVF